LFFFFFFFLFFFLFEEPLRGTKNECGVAPLLYLLRLVRARWLSP